jgi:hypothetical protein
VGVGGGGVMGVICFVDESSVGLKLSIHHKFTLPMSLGTGIHVCLVDGGWCW